MKTVLNIRKLKTNHYSLFLKLFKDFKVTPCVDFPDDLIWHLGKKLLFYQDNGMKKLSIPKNVWDKIKNECDLTNNDDVEDYIRHIVHKHYGIMGFQIISYSNGIFTSKHNILKNCKIKSEYERQ